MPGKGRLWTAAWMSHPVFSFSFHVRVAWGSRPPCAIVVAGYACSHSFMVFIRVVSLWRTIGWLVSL